MIKNENQVELFILLELAIRKSCSIIRFHASCF